MKKKSIATLLMLCFVLTTSLLARATATITTVSLKVYKTSEGKFVVETDDLKVVIEELSQNHHRFICIDKMGNRTEFEIIVANSSVLLYFNGTETLLPVNENSSASTLSIEPVTASIRRNYWWDSVYFVDGRGIKYPHPDRDYYGIETFSDWVTTGTKLYHYQFREETSNALKTGGPAVIGAAIGAIVGTYLVGPPYGTLVGAIVAAIIATVLVLTGAVVLFDEEGCMWYWVSKAWTKWLIDNAAWLALLNAISFQAATAAAMTAFLSCGYLRVGSVTFYDAVGAGNPAPPSGGSTGGLDVPIDKVSLITPYIASTLMVCVGFIVSSRKFGKRKRS